MSAKEKHSDLERYIKARDNWDAVAMKYSNDGAADTEPRYTLYWLLENFVKYEKVLLPLTADQWQLYTCARPCKRAANALNKATQELLDVLCESSLHGLKRICKYYGYNF